MVISLQKAFFAFSDATLQILPVLGLFWPVLRTNEFKQ